MRFLLLCQEHGIRSEKNTEISVHVAYYISSLGLCFCMKLAIGLICIIDGSID